MESRHLPRRLIIHGLAGLLACLAWLPLSGAESTAPDADNAFVRFVEGDGEYSGQLQTAIATYSGPGGVELDLVAAVHMAETGYYQTLNDYFDSRDAVLYELVAEADVRPDGKQPAGGGGVLGFIQGSLSRLLGLDFQLDSINYARSHFVHADLEPAELAQIMEVKGETLLSQIIALALAEMAYQEQQLQSGQEPAFTVSLAEIMGILSQPDSRNGFKYLLGKSLIGAEGMFSAAQTGGITILDDRNEAALAALRESLEDPDLKNLSIFYGAAHMPGLEQGILELGFQPRSRRWLTAWQTN